MTGAGSPEVAHSTHWTAAAQAAPVPLQEAHELLRVGRRGLQRRDAQRQRAAAHGARQQQRLLAADLNAPRSWRARAE